MPSVRLVDVTKEFTGVKAVDDVTLEVPDGVLMALLGPSGCGKTTTLRMVAGLERPTSGEILIGDDCVSSKHLFVPPDKRQIGMVFQSYAIWPHMRVVDNVAYPLRVRGLPRAQIRERTIKALHTVQLLGYEGRFATQLSGGQQQRVALARAIVFEPRILLLDEPLSNLDANLREQMRVEVRELQQRLGITTIYVTHDQAEALAVSDLIAVIDRGKVVQIGSPREIYGRPSTRFVADFLGWANFVPGEVVDRTTVRAFGSLVRCEVPAGIATGAAVLLTVRPENVKVVPAPVNGTANVLCGRAKAATYMGSHFCCQVVVEDQVVQALAPTSSRVAAGDLVGLELHPEHILVLSN